MAVFSLYYAERLGHCIWWQPPAYFSVFISMIRPFIDPATYEKVVIIKGDASPGSANDRTMTVLIGPDWRAKTGAGGARTTPGTSPGYVHSDAWQHAVDEEAAYDTLAQTFAPKADQGAVRDSGIASPDQAPSPSGSGSECVSAAGQASPSRGTDRMPSVTRVFRAVAEGDEATVQCAVDTDDLDVVSCTNFVRFGF